MSEFLKGNFEVKNKIVENVKEKKDKHAQLQEKFEKAALASIGGSMVYVKKTNLTWDGDNESK